MYIHIYCIFCQSEIHTDKNISVTIDFLRNKTFGMYFLIRQVLKEFLLSFRCLFFRVRLAGTTVQSNNYRI